MTVVRELKKQAMVGGVCTRVFGSNNRKTRIPATDDEILERSDVSREEVVQMARAGDHADVSDRIVEREEVIVLNEKGDEVSRAPPVELQPPQDWFWSQPGCKKILCAEGKKDKKNKVFASFEITLVAGLADYLRMQVQKQNMRCTWWGLLKDWLREVMNWEKVAHEQLIVNVAIDEVVSVMQDVEPQIRSFVECSLSRTGCTNLVTRRVVMQRLFNQVVARSIGNMSVESNHLDLADIVVHKLLKEHGLVGLLWSGRNVVPDSDAVYLNELVPLK